jgi:hypothetical protein
VFAKMQEAPDVAPAPGRRNRFARRPPSGVHTVTVWLRPLTVAAGRSKHVDLTDRGAWLTGVVEQRGGEALPGSAQMPDR